MYLVMLYTMVLQVYPVERVSQRFQGLFPDFRFQLTFPYRDAVPAHRCKLMLHFVVALFVPSYFIHPELAVRLWNLTTFGTLNYEL